jgi:hypothetical protein
LCQCITERWRSCEMTRATASLLASTKRAADWCRIPPNCSSSGAEIASCIPGTARNVVTRGGTAPVGTTIFAPNPRTTKSRVITTAPSTPASGAIARIVRPTLPEPRPSAVATSILSLLDRSIAKMRLIKFPRANSSVSSSRIASRMDEFGDENLYANGSIISAHCPASLGTTRSVPPCPSAIMSAQGSLAPHIPATRSVCARCRLVEIPCLAHAEGSDRDRYRLPKLPNCWDRRPQRTDGMDRHPT